MQRSTSAMAVRRCMSTSGPGKRTCLPLRPRVSGMDNAGDKVNHEVERLRQITDDAHGWRRWGPYVSDRAWGTVREDYSADGNAWGYITYDASRAKAYRWGEDGIAGICDRYQLLCFAPTF